MTDITDYDQLLEEVRKRCDELFDKVWGELNRMAGVLNDAASHFDWGYVLFPIPKLIWDGLTSDDVERAIDYFNNEIRPQLEEKAETVVGDIRKVVGTLAGDPPGLKQLSFDYAACRAKLVYPAPSIQSEIQQLGKSWKGPAYAAYSLAAGEQVKAMSDAALGMDRAADMTNKGAAKILQLWVDLNDKLIAGLVDLVKLLSDATTVDKILSFEIPVVVSAIGDLIEFVQAIAKTLEDYWIGVGFQDQLDWIKLNNGAIALPHNTWPVVHPGRGRRHLRPPRLGRRRLTDGPQRKRLSFASPWVGTVIGTPSPTALSAQPDVAEESGERRSRASTAPVSVTDWVSVKRASSSSDSSSTSRQ